MFYNGYINKDQSEWFQMALTDIIKEIQKLNTADQLRLKEFFTKSLAATSASEPIFKEVSEQKHKDGYTYYLYY